MHVVIETSKKQMKYLFSNCRQSPVADATGFVLFWCNMGHRELEQSRWIWRRCSKRKSGHMPEVGANRVDLEKMLQGEKRAYVWNWSKAGRFGEDAPRGKEGICLELEQSWWIWRNYSKLEMVLSAGVGTNRVDMEKLLQTGKVA